MIPESPMFSPDVLCSGQSTLRWITLRVPTGCPNEHHVLAKPTDGSKVLKTYIDMDLVAVLVVDCVCYGSH